MSTKLSADLTATCATRRYRIEQRGGLRMGPHADPDRDPTSLASFRYGTAHSVCLSVRARITPGFQCPPRIRELLTDFRPSKGTDRAEEEPKTVEKAEKEFSRTRPNSGEISSVWTARRHWWRSISRRRRSWRRAFWLFRPPRPNGPRIRHSQLYWRRSIRWFSAGTARRLWRTEEKHAG
jgi:hypothetical protein